MSNNYFEFRQFRIEQKHTAMKVGTDGVLLGSWTHLSGGERRVLDIGTGTGLLALMLAQRLPNAMIDAIEIDALSVEEARLNVGNSPWRERIDVMAISLQSYVKDIFDSKLSLQSKTISLEHKYDLIISNPPYFNSSYRSSNAGRMVARHTELLSYDDLMEGVYHLLSTEGRFVTILPYVEGSLFIASASSMGLYARRVVSVYSKFSNPVKRILLEFSFERGSVESCNFVIEETYGGYTMAYKDLTRDFYLRF